MCTKNIDLFEFPNLQEPSTSITYKHAIYRRQNHPTGHTWLVQLLHSIPYLRTTNTKYRQYQNSLCCLLTVFRRFCWWSVWRMMIPYDTCIHDTNHHANLAYSIHHMLKVTYSSAYRQPGHFRLQIEQWVSGAWSHLWGSTPYTVNKFFVRNIQQAYLIHSPFWKNSENRKTYVHIHHTKK